MDFKVNLFFKDVIYIVLRDKDHIYFGLYGFLAFSIILNNV